MNSVIITRRLIFMQIEKLSFNCVVFGKHIPILFSYSLQQRRQIRFSDGYDCVSCKTGKMSELEQP